MTTILGIRAAKGEPGVILASDLQRTRTDFTEGGEVIRKVQTKEDGQKIYVDDAQNVAICMTGTFDQAYVDFLNGVRSGKIDVEKAIKDKFFREIENLTLSRWKGRAPTSDINYLIIATRFNQDPRLYACYPLGRVDETKGISVGAGSEYANKICDSRRVDLPDYITLTEASELAIKGLEAAASKDIYTGGLDIVVVTKDGVKPLGNIVQEELDKARSQYTARIKKSLKR